MQTEEMITANLPRVRRWTAGSSQPRRRSALARTERFVIAGQVSFVLFAPVSFAVTLGLC
ncbi:MAG: hypothetical protein ACK56I_26080 [bacterium]